MGMEEWEQIGNMLVSKVPEFDCQFEIDRD